MAYEARTFQSTTTNTPPSGTDPLVDNTASGDVQAVKLLDPTAGSTTPLIGQKARSGSMPVALSTEDAAALASQTTLAAVLAKLSADPSTETTLNAILAKIIAAPATSAKQDALAALIGEVQASPTSNTLLDRLKQIQSALAGTLAISASSLPLPSGAATSANQSTANTSLSSIDGKLPALVSSRVPVDPSGVTSPVSVASLPLPSGAATAAKQPALGTAGTASADVLTVQGITSMTPLKVDGSGVAQPISAASLPLPSGASTLAEQQTQTTSLQLIDDVVFAEDAASANGDKGVQVLAVRKATPANTSGTDGDYEPLQVSAGRLWASATIDAALPAGTNAIGKLAANDGVDIGDVTINNAGGGSAVNIQDGGNSITVDGTVAATQSGAWNVGTQTGTWTDRSGTITTGGTAQQLAASNSSRKAYFIQNIGTADLWLSLVGTAAADSAGSIKLAPSAALAASTPFVSTQAISIIGATTGQKFTAYEA